MERLSMSMFGSKVDYDAAVAAQSALKPVVKYRFANDRPVVGDSCNIIPLDHPGFNLNGKLAHTSGVVSVAENGVDFETRNTRYVLEA